MVRSLTRFLFIVAFASLIAASNSYGQRTIFVNKSATGLNDGSSWTDAFVSLQDAITAAASGDEIWVAADTYYPDEGVGITPGDREASFFMKGGVGVYGGFGGTESSRSQRNWDDHVTELSGDLGNNDVQLTSLQDPTREDNSLHVVRIQGAVEPVVLDGFTVTAGNALNNLGLFQSGAGISVNSPVELRHLTIINNTADRGAGIALFGRDGWIQLIEDVRFEDNIARDWGGGLLNESFSSQLYDLHFTGNQAGSGGGLYNIGILTLVGAEFTKNSAVEGGGIYCTESSPLYVVNATFFENEALFGGGVHVDQGETKAPFSIINSVFSGNTAERGGAISSFTGPMQIVNTSIVFITASISGGGIYHTVYNSIVDIRNSILWGNSGNGIGDQFHNVLTTGVGEDGLISSTLSYSLLEGPLPDGVTNDGRTQSNDPLFIDPIGSDGVRGSADDDYRLQANSSAIDGGYNSFLPPDSLDLDGDGNLFEPLPIDLDVNVRVFDGGSGTATVDLGPYEFGAPPLIVAVEEPAVPRETGLTLSRPFPNPFRTATMITFSSKRGGHATLTVYDMLGRRVRVLFDGVLQPAQARNVTLEGKHLAPGAYVIQLQDGHQVSNQLIVRSRI